MNRFIVKKTQSKKIYPQFLNRSASQLTQTVTNEIIPSIGGEKMIVDEHILTIGENVIENNEKKENVMDTQEKILMAQAVLNQNNAMAPKVKKVRKEKGLIEKTESSKIILTEDNRELLND